jgi:hypothetical protein
MQSADLHFLDGPDRIGDERLNANGEHPPDLVPKSGRFVSIVSESNLKSGSWRLRATSTK